MVGFTDQPVPFRPLWTDRPDAAETLAARYAEGRMSQAERDDLAHLAEHGWLVWREAIDAATIDAFVHDIHMVHLFPGMFLTTGFRKGGGLVLSDDKPDRYESLFDLYVNLDSARQVCLHPRITRFLSLVFDNRVLAFQQLLFQRSNGHTLHQDTSVVVVEQPLQLVATWIALEDVIEGSGELAYYDRSHRLPHYLFSGGNKYIVEAQDDRGRYIHALREACEQRGLEYGRFLARKGDVFIWTADLVHCSHDRSLPEETSRLSCVTHYCPASTAPNWFRDPGHKVVEPHDMISAFASMHYPLPTGGRMLRPDSPKLRQR